MYIPDVPGHGGSELSIYVYPRCPSTWLIRSVLTFTSQMSQDMVDHSCLYVLPRCPRTWLITAMLIITCTSQMSQDMVDHSCPYNWFQYTRSVQETLVLIHKLGSLYQLSSRNNCSNHTPTQCRKQWFQYTTVHCQKSWFQCTSSVQEKLVLIYQLSGSNTDSSTPALIQENWLKCTYQLSAGKTGSNALAWFRKNWF